MKYSLSALYSAGPSTLLRTASLRSLLRGQELNLAWEIMSLPCSRTLPRMSMNLDIIA